MNEEFDLETIAIMSKLEFTDSELLNLKKDFGKFLEFIAPIKDEPEVPHYNTVGIESLREDIVKPSLSIEYVHKNTPQRNGRFFAVPQAVE